MKLNILTAAINVRMEADGDIDISGIQSDSRKIERGNLFVAVKGTAVDGHDFIQEAVDRGAVAILCERKPERPVADGIPLIIIEGDATGAMGRLLSEWYGNPSRRLILTGVTGTNGKTTTATLLYELFRRMGHRVGLLSTVCNYIDGRAVPATHTTPDPVALHALIAEMADEGCEYVFMEVSSHATDQNRIAGLSFRGGVFTNLTRDHLDYHQTVDNYLRAKKRFFDNLPADAFAITNIDDRNGLVMLQNTRARKISYALRTMADCKGRVIECRLDGTVMEIDGREVSVRFAGRFNVYNLLAVYCTAVALGKEAHETLVCLSALVPVTGRFEPFHSPLGYTAIVDYAHTPDALVNVLDTIRDTVGAASNIITVVGAGGNRDKGKRPIMAFEAARRSDLLIMTADNPRNEDPEDILDDMLAGLDRDQAERTLRIADRAQAIKTATMMAKKGDVILVAGKGHEDYQEVMGVKRHFDDREELSKIFAKQNKQE